ncbi:TssN family type VI secretion system protein [Runella zeae]|uniref:TssN family type VI secretion system protein n=1 Tax=Runella zeae TaxID=94255 RepID=UPI000415A599|nr:TssN family type VI secretion system protein [Runella zeae]
MSSTVLTLFIGNIVFGIANLGILAYLKSAEIFSKKLLMHILGVFVMFAALGGVVSQISSVGIGFIVFETGALILGIVFVMTAYKSFRTWLSRDEFTPGLWLCISLMFFGIAGFILSYSLIKKQEGMLTPYLSLGALRYLLPYLFIKSYDFWQSIPVLQYRKWYYPLNSKVPIIELRNTQRVKIRIFKQPNSSVWEGHEFEAPKDRELGEWMQYMIELYNTKVDPAHPIIVVDVQTGKPFGWVFYKTSFFGFVKTYYDPNKTFTQNNITTSTPIVARSFID